MLEEEIFDRIKDIYDNNGNVELEAKFGFYKENGDFNSSVPYVHYERLLEKLKKERKEEREESHVSQNSNIRKIVITPEDNNEQKIIWQRKTKIEDFNFNQYDLRISINKEEEIGQQDNFNAQTIRERTRHTFRINENIKVDMTEVIMTTGMDRKAITRYEVEVEYVGGKLDVSAFRMGIESIFKNLRGSELVYSTKDKNLLIQNVNQKIINFNAEGAYQVQSNYNIDKSILVQSRNIKKKDLVWGGIVGNRDNNYMITYKADGIRKMFIIHSTGVWLIYPPFEYNLVIGRDGKTSKLLDTYNLTIFDGELVSSKNDMINYWYLAFDCIVFANTNIEKQKYTERIKTIKSLTRYFQQNLLKVDFKDTEEIKSTTDFFVLVGKFLDNKRNLGYQEDGLMFIPSNSEYNPRTNIKPKYKQVLTENPDTCKWKEAKNITIDFSIKHTLQATIELYSYDTAKKSLVIFKGDDINPLTSTMIDHNHPLTKNLPTNTIVEYEWIQSLDSGFLRPRRIRYDKSGPNTLLVALDDWVDIMNPISEKDIRGETFALTFAYHNRIKSSLYSNIKKAHILDIGSGFGGDVAKWINIGGSVVAVEPNSKNRELLVNRIKTFKMEERVKIVETGGEDTIAITNAVRDFIPGGKVDFVTLMLSLSFFWASSTHLDALVNTIVTNLKPGGKILFFTIYGDTVLQLFQPTFANSFFTDYNILDAHLHLYTKPPPPFGQPLDFFLPNTIVGEQREYIVRLQDLTQRLSKFGINLERVHRAEEEKLLSPPNQLYSSLYSYGSYINTNTDNSFVSPNNLSLPILPEPIDFIVDSSTPSHIIDTNLSTQNNIIMPIDKLNQFYNNPPDNLNQSSHNLPDKLNQSSHNLVDKLNQSSNNPLNNLNQSDNIETVPNATTTDNSGINRQIVTPNINKMLIENNQLPSLPVIYTDKNAKILNGPAKYDDTYAVLTCTWYNNLVRIATIGDGNCFIHAILKGCYSDYQNNNNAKYRLDVAQSLRRDLAVMLDHENPLYPGHTYWETSGRGSFPRMVIQEIKDEQLIGDLRVDYTLFGLQRLLNSSNFLGDEVYSYISDVLNIDIYVLRATSQDLYPHLHTKQLGLLRNAVVIVGNMNHYEVLALPVHQGFQTLFPPNHPFLVSLTNLFIGDGGFNDIINQQIFHPDTVFINELVEAFTINNSFSLPPTINEIFHPTDAFITLLNRVLPFIYKTE